MGESGLRRGQEGRGSCGGSLRVGVGVLSSWGSIDSFGIIVDER